MADGYFVDDAEADAFRDELKHLLVTQKAAFNSPVWFNIGVAGVPQQASACFILSVDDTMDSILNWYREEGVIFKGGSGSGINLSKIRSSVEPLNGGGTASGPVSFMRGADAVRGHHQVRRQDPARRQDGHPQRRPPRRARVHLVQVEGGAQGRVLLRDAGFDMDLDGKDSHSIQYQNANNSVRVTDEFMEAVVETRSGTSRPSPPARSSRRSRPAT